MRKIGLIVAVEEEAMRQKYGEGYDLNDGYGTVLYQTAKSQVYALYSGAGEIFAAAATQYLIDHYEVAAVLNYGVVGGCREDLMADEPCLVDCVVHWQYDLSDVDGVPVGQYMEYYPDRRLQTDERLMEMASRVFPHLRHVCCASGDKFMGKAEEKLWLRREFGADVCDMEAAAILLTCDRNDVPCLMVKTVADSVRGGAAEYWNEKGRTAMTCLDIVDKLIDEM